MSTLVKIKRLLIAGAYQFTDKAAIEIARDHLTQALVIEAILNAPAIVKRLNSQNPLTGKREKLYVITGQTYSGLVIYTKGTIRDFGDRKEYYIIISSKRDVEV